METDVTTQLGDETFSPIAYGFNSNLCGAGLTGSLSRTYAPASTVMLFETRGNFANLGSPTEGTSFSSPDNEMDTESSVGNGAITDNAPTGLYYTFTGTVNWTA
jgi:hypothetical protein